MDKNFLKKELAEQLSCPSGSNGLAVAKKMNESNISMTLATIQEMGLTDGQFVLELGHGNAGHLAKVFSQASDLHYFGLEISVLMKQEAERQNNQLLRNGSATFSLYDGLKLPFDDNTFDIIFTVNTLYFWKKPVELLNDMHRVLKKGGICFITFAQKKFMQGLSFTKNKFTMYDNNDMKALVSNTPFELIEIINKSEQVKSKTGEMVKRDYTIFCLKG
jgi:ubiquinone/menaquinone biosynthesis C-methylase UbiE